MTRVLVVYPEVGDENWVSLLITQETDVNELKSILCTEFGLNIEKPVYLIYWYQERESILPLTSLKHLLFSKNEEESLVVRVRGEIQSSSSRSSSLRMLNPDDVWEDQKYFTEYSHYHIHHQMLSDFVRCLTYKNAIEEYSDLIRNKVVLDVGCGTGLLSCFCAKVGAKKVFAVEASEMASAAELVVAKNGFSDIIQVFHCKVEDVVLPVNKVDVIVSEWMGVFLLFEGMLESVICARNKWLSAEGTLFPTKAKLYLAPINYDEFFEKKVNIFNDVHGIDMTPLIPFAKEDFTAHPLKGEVVAPHCILSDPALILSIDISTVQPEEIRKFVSTFSFCPTSQHDKMHGFVTWFEVIFEGKDPNRKQIILSTSPYNKITHWKQDVFLMNEPIPLQSNNNNLIKGIIRVSQLKQYRRHYEVEFSFSVNQIDYYKQFIL